MNKILEKYVVKNEFSGEVNPKVIRTIIWRTITNMAKHKTSQDLIASNATSIAVSGLETLQKCKSDAGIVNSCVMALNNIVFLQVAKSYQAI